MLLINGANIMFIIVFRMILIVATMIYIVFAKIGSVLKHLKNVRGNCYLCPMRKSQRVSRQTYAN